MRSTDPIQWKAPQDVIAKYGKTARTIMGQLVQRNKLAKIGELPWMSKVIRKLKDGTVITCWSLPVPAGFKPIQIVKVKTAAGAGSQGIYIWGLESGLILFSTQEIEGIIRVVNTTFPLSVYLGEDLTSYVNGPGSSLSNYSEAKFLFWGDRKEDPVGACLSWPGDFPLGTENEYTSEYLTSAAGLEGTQGHVIDPCWYSGKCRLAAQGKIKAGDTISDLAPASWATSVYGQTCNLGQSDGIFHDGIYNYWLIRTDSSGCKAVKLDIPESKSPVECVRTMLREDELSAADKVRLEAYLLAALVPVAGSEIEVRTAAEMAAVYEDDKGPIAHGWNYSAQDLVADVTEAMIVTLREADGSTPTAFYYSTWVYKIVFTVSESTVSAVLTEEEGEADFYPASGEDNIYTYDYEEQKPLWWNRHTTTDAPVGNNVAFYCFWSREHNGWEIIRYYYDQISGTASATPTASWACYQHTAENLGYRNPTISRILFDKNLNASLLRGSTGTGDYIEKYYRVWKWAIEGSIDCGCYKPSLPADCCDCTEHPFDGVAAAHAKICDPTISYNSDECYDITHYLGSGTIESVYEILYGSAAQKRLIITEDPESVYALEVTTYDNLSARNTELYYRDNNLLIKSDYVGRCTGHSILGAQQQITLSTGSSGADCGGGTGGTWEIGSHTDTNESGAGVVSHTSLVTSHELIDLDDSDPSVWQIFWGSLENPYPEVSFPAQFSAIHGDTVYRPTPTDLDVTGDYQADAGELTSKVKRFIGHA